MHRERSGDDLVFLKKSNVQLILYALASLLEDHKGAWMHALSPSPTPAAVCVVMQRAMKICLYMNRLANEMGSRASSCPCLIPASPKGTIINSVALSRGYKLKLEALVEGHEWRWDSWVTDHPLTGKKVWVDIRIFQETWLMCSSHIFCFVSCEDSNDLVCCLLTEDRCSGRCHRLSWGRKHVMTKFTDVRTSEII